MTGRRLFIGQCGRTTRMSIQWLIFSSLRCKLVCPTTHSPLSFSASSVLPGGGHRCRIRRPQSQSQSAIATHVMAAVSSSGCTARLVPDKHRQTVTHTHTDRQTDTHRQTDRHTHTHTHTYTQTHIQIQTHTDTDTHRKRHTQIHRHTDTHRRGE